MPSSDAELIHDIVQSTGRYLDRFQRMQLLWADVDAHIAASHIAESMGDTALAARHLQAVTRLFVEIYGIMPQHDRRRRAQKRCAA